MSITIKDVARYADVSTATVSNVINDKGRVGSETKKKVLEAIDKLDYRPNFSARSLVGQNTNLIGILIPFWDDNLLLDGGEISRYSNYFYGRLFDGIETVAVKRRYNILSIGPHNDCDDIKNIIKQRNLDGLIIVGGYNELLASLKETEIPIVVVDSYLDNDNIYNIGIDDESGGYIATKHLLDLGHRDIGLILGDLNEKSVAMERFKGYKRALQERNIEMKDKNINIDNLGAQMNVGYKGIENLLAENKNITAVFSTADVISIGIYKKLKELNLEIPTDISIVSFDDFPYAEFIHPALTTIRQPIFLKGTKATEVLIDLINGKEINKKNVKLPIELIKRESVKRKNG